MISQASLVSSPEFVPFSFDSAYKTLQKKPKQDPFNRSQLHIKALEEPLKCEVEIPVTVQYTIAGETAESVTIVYLVGAEMKQKAGHFCRSAILLSVLFTSLSDFIKSTNSLSRV